MAGEKGCAAMNEAMGSGSEVVGLFAERESFERAVEELLRSGFERADLSVLASHESLEAAGRPGKSWREAMLALVGELKYEGPLVASGAIFLAGGPIVATIAAVIGAAVGGAAAVDLLGEVTAKPHTEDFARSLAAGSVILWVRAPDGARRARATAILQANGAGNVHVARAGREAAPTARA
jgi:hypothetical protein